MIKYIAVVISFILGAFSINYIRDHDIFEKEPIVKMSFVTVIGGIISVLISIGLYILFKNIGYNFQNNFLDAYFKIGPVEEFAKLITFVVLLPFLSKDLDEPIDYIIYISCLTLGFSLIENIMYATKEQGNLPLLFIRLGISTPMHIAFSAVMGLAIYLYNNLGYKINTIFGAFVFASILHGTFDFLILIGLGWIVLFVLYRYYWKEIFFCFSYLTALNRKVSFQSYVNNLKTPNGSKKAICINCGNNDKKNYYKIGKAKLFKCANCGKIIATRDSIFWLFHYFSGNYDAITKNYKLNENGNLYSLFSGNYIDDYRKIGYINVDEMDSEINKIKTNDKEKFEKSILAKYFLGISQDNLIKI
ncbi:MAG TPA: PrsW family intramembrane metalloprotease [Chitinivibrionales bacterium]|nr:PrsW family intramembrane metalloprotease [Chitinivibrionales bacterium]